MNIVGLDIDSRKFGASLFEDGKYVISTFYESEEKEIQNRLFDLYDKVEILVLNLFKPDKIYIEESIYVSNFKTSRALSESIANVKLLCRLHQIKFEMVQNTSWKKEIIGNGKCSKEDIKNFIVKKFPQLEEDRQDVFDSCGIAMYGVKNENKNSTN